MDHCGKIALWISALWRRFRGVGDDAAEAGRPVANLVRPTVLATGAVVFAALAVGILWEFDPVTASGEVDGAGANGGGHEAVTVAGGGFPAAPLGSGRSGAVLSAPDGDAISPGEALAARLVADFEDLGPGGRYPAVDRQLEAIGTGGTAFAGGEFLALFAEPGPGPSAGSAAFGGAAFGGAAPAGGIPALSGLGAVDPAIVEDLPAVLEELANQVIEPSPSVVPIPAALPLLGTGLASLGFFALRRRRVA